MHPDLGFIKDNDKWVACGVGGVESNFMRDDYFVFDALKELGISDNNIIKEPARSKYGNKLMNGYYHVYLKFDNEVDEAEFVLKMTAYRAEQKI